MKRVTFIILLMVISATGSLAHARETVTVHTGMDRFKADVFAKRQESGRPAVIVLSGSRGTRSPAYDEIGNAFMTAGFDVYLPHLLSEHDLQFIASAEDARSRIEYYNERRRYWVGNLKAFVSMLHSQGYKGKTGILGISLGAQTAAIAVSEGLSADAAVLVDGASPNSEFLRQNPPQFHLIWGGADRIYPVSTGRHFAEVIKKAGGTATMTVFEGAPHDFFLKSETVQAREAYRVAIEFLMSKLKN